MPEHDDQRPSIPAPLKRLVLVEAGHRCAIPTCRQHPVEIAHIDPWSKVKAHEFDNLIALCPTCHTRYDLTKEIDRQGMLAYKKQLARLVAPRSEAIPASTPSAETLAGLVDRAHSGGSLTGTLAVALPLAVESGLERLEQFIRNEILGFGEETLETDMPAHRFVPAFIVAPDVFWNPQHTLSGAAKWSIMEGKPDVYHPQHVAFGKPVSELEMRSVEEQEQFDPSELTEMRKPVAEVATAIPKGVDPDGMLATVYMQARPATRVVRQVRLALVDELLAAMGEVAARSTQPGR